MVHAFLRKISFTSSPITYRKPFLSRQNKLARISRLSAPVALCSATLHKTTRFMAFREQAETDKNVLID